MTCSWERELLVNMDRLLIATQVGPTPANSVHSGIKTCGLSLWIVIDTVFDKKENMEIKLKGFHQVFFDVRVWTC